MQLKKVIFILLILLYSINIVGAETVTVSDFDGSSDQEQINEALEYAANTLGTTVDLGSRTYIIDGTIWIYPNTVLKGSGAVIRTDSESSWWFREGVPTVGCKVNPHDIEIYGITFDGNNGAFPSKWANDGAGKAHNCQKIIIFAGSSNNFGKNIFIHDCTFYNSFSDAVYLRYIDSVKCYNNFISNCQHEGIYFSVVTNGLMYGNKIAGITSDCARLDNCANCKVYDNIFFSYGGDTNTYKHGENGLQIGDAGSSKGYSGQKANFKTKNIEVFGNTFADPGLKAIWLHPGTENVWIHDNKFIDADELKTSGIPTDISYDNPPTIEDSEEIFSSIFDIFNTKFYEIAGNSTAKYSSGETITTPTKATGTITQYKGQNITLVYVPPDNLTSIHFKQGNRKTVHTLMLGERHGFSTIYSNVSIWSGDIPRQGDSVQFDGIIDPDDIEVTCYTVKGSFNPDFSVITIENKVKLFPPVLIFAFLILLVCFIYCRFVIKYTF